MNSNSKSLLNPLKEALDLKPMLKCFDKDFNKLENTSFYVISVKWLNQWKQYTHFDSVSSISMPIVDDKLFDTTNHNKEMEIEFDRPGKINKDLIDTPNNVFYYKEDNHMCNIYLKKNLSYGLDYEFVTENVWSYLSQIYPSIEIKRPAFYLNDGNRRVEVSFLRFNLIFINSKMINLIDEQIISHFKQFYFQVYSHESINQMKENIIKGLHNQQLKSLFEYINPVSKEVKYYGPSLSSDNSDILISPENVRLWKLDSFTNPNAIFKDIQDICKTNWRKNDFKIPFPGDLLNDNQNVLLNDTEIADNEFIFIEIKESSSNWNFVGLGATVFGFCAFCDQEVNLPFHCQCGKVKYLINLFSIYIHRQAIVHLLVNLKIDLNIDLTVRKKMNLIIRK